jgi:Domain of unknown function (DUF1707)/Cell wall-active antibiotics response 4TMS YvqF
VHPEPFNANSRLRASDSDRERAAAVLNTALAEGRLSVAEHSERLDAVYEAKTHAQIAPLVDDLPSRATDQPVAPRTDVAPAGKRRQMIVAIFGGTSRKGQWHVEPRMVAVTVMGGATFDFRDVQLPQREITLNCTTIFGGVEIVVPPEMRVIDSGIALFGGRDAGPGSEESRDPNAPVLRLTGVTLFGGLGVKHKRRKVKNKDDRG